MAIFGLVVAGMGAYRDVAWHVSFGRDEGLFTAPHTAIVLGLWMLVGAALAGAFMARQMGVEKGLRLGGGYIPWSLLALGVLGATALAGFPLDELWHRLYGIDLTMWSPPHLLMILGASLAPLALWLVLAEAGVHRYGRVRIRGFHAATALAVLLGLSSVQGEFLFGVPQFQQLYHPTLVAIAAGLSLTAARLVCGPGWAFLVAFASFAIGTANVLATSGPGTATAAIYLASGLVVEATGRWIGLRRVVVFAVVSGVGVGTIGLLGAAWAWNQGGPQPWTLALLPDALVLGVGAGVGACLLGAAFGGAVCGDRLVGWPAVAVAGLIVAVALAWPAPRNVSEASAHIELAPAGEGSAFVRARLEPEDVAHGARWFQAVAWQGGGLVVSDMDQVTPGHYASRIPLPLEGGWKVVLRLHSGAAMGLVPIRLPPDTAADSEIVVSTGEPVAFLAEEPYLLREQGEGPPWASAVGYGLLGLVAVAWVAALGVAAIRVSGGPSSAFFSRKGP